MNVLCNGQVATSIIFFFPYIYPVTQDNMNWTIVVVAATVTVAGLNWVFVARHTFTGPKRMDPAASATNPNVMLVPSGKCTEGKGADDTIGPSPLIWEGSA